MAKILSFFPPPNVNAGDNNLCVLNTIGWKGQAELNEQGVGFISKGTSRYVVMDKNGAEDCVEKLWS